MNFNDAPDFVVKRILVLTDRVKALADERDKASNKLKRARANLESPRFQNDIRELQDKIDHVRADLYKIERIEQAAKEARAMGGSVIDHPKNKAELTVKKVKLEKEMEKLKDDHDVKAIVQAHDAIEMRCKIEEGILARCRDYINRLPEDAKLERITITPEKGDTLPYVRKIIADTHAELTKLQRVTEPAKDIRKRVEAYVSDLADSARPQIRGVEAGGILEVTWPHESGNGYCVNGLNGAPNRIGIDALALTALVAGETLIDALVDQIEDDADKPISRANRPKRIAQLQQDLIEFAYREEHQIEQALLKNEPVTRNANAKPDVVLGVKLVKVEREVCAA